MNLTVLSIFIIFCLAFVYVAHSSMLDIAGHNIFDEESQPSKDSKCPNGAKLGKGNIIFIGNNRMLIIYSL